MDLSKTHSHFPRALVKEGIVLSVTLYVYLPHNQSLILYRKAGDKIGPENIGSLKKIPADQLYYSNGENELLYKMGGEALALDLKSGNVDTPAVKETAQGMLNTLNEGENLADCMTKAANLVQTLIRDFGKSNSVNAYDEAIRMGKDPKLDPLTNHHQQTSAIAVLIALAIGEFRMEDISDLAAAGLLHDLGLTEITHSLAQSHFKEVKEMSTQEKVIYMRHVELSLELLKKQKIQVTPGIERIILHHHESWDGLGFKRYAGNKIYRPARVLKLADDLVSTIQGSNYTIGFKSGVEVLNKNSHLYDPDMIAKLLQEAAPV